MPVTALPDADPKALASPVPTTVPGPLPLAPAAEKPTAAVVAPRALVRAAVLRLARRRSACRRFWRAAVWIECCMLACSLGRRHSGHGAAQGGTGGVAAEHRASEPTVRRGEGAESSE